MNKGVVVESALIGCCGSCDALVWAGGLSRRSSSSRNSQLCAPGGAGTWAPRWSCFRRRGPLHPHLHLHHPSLRMKSRGFHTKHQQSKSINMMNHSIQQSESINTRLDIHTEQLYMPLTNHSIHVMSYETIFAFSNPNIYPFKVIYPFIVIILCYW